MTSNTTSDSDTRPVVGLFVTCLADLFRPKVAESVVVLLEKFGCRVEVPVQSCCGQPAFNSGEENKTRTLALNFISQFSGYEYIVAPSGSCVAMVKMHYPGLFENGSDAHDSAVAIADKTWELSQFLLEVLEVDPGDSDEASGRGRPLSVTYHDSCSGLRELGIRSGPRKLLRSMRSIDIQEMGNAEICCGFGGTFCVKYPEISTRMVDDKIAGIKASGCDVLTGGDLGCLMNIAGRLRREGSDVRVNHYAELLVGDMNEPAIGE